MSKKEKEKEKKKDKNPYHKEYGLWSNLRFILGYAVKYDKAFLGLIPLGMVVAPIMQYLWTFISKFVIDMITGEGEIRNLFFMMAGFTVLQMVSTMANTYYYSEYGWRCIRFRFLLMNNEQNYKVMKIDFEHLEDSDVMDCYSKSKNACNNNMEGVEGMLRNLISFSRGVTVVLGGLLILGTMNLWVVLIMTILAVISFVISNHINATAKKTVWDPLATWWRKKYYMTDITTNFDVAKDIRMFHLKDWLLSKLHGLNEIRYQSEKKNSTLWLMAGIVSNVCWALAQGVVYGWLITSLVKGKLTLGNFSLYVATTESFFQYMNTLLTHVRDMLARSREVDDFRSFTEFDGGDNEEAGAMVPAAERYEFRFENVSFKYPKAEQYALKNLNLTLKAGERLAVVGLNGAGKSTFIKLLLRLYEPTEGTIYLNGVDVRTYNKRSYYRVFAPVFQDVNLFAFPLSENISMKPPVETDKAAAKKCLVDAGLAEKLKELPQDVDTEVLKVIYDDGVDFSGGEKQKLALARALYKKAPVVVLDEPTAALDALAEHKLYQDFDKLIGGKTAVYISHRLSSTQFCDHVAMFAEGELVEYGTHQSLLAKGGAYAEMFQVQAQYYVEEKAEQEVAVC